MGCQTNFLTEKGEQVVTIIEGEKEESDFFPLPSLFHILPPAFSLIDSPVLDNLHFYSHKNVFKLLVMFKEP